MAQCRPHGLVAWWQALDDKRNLAAASSPVQSLREV